MAQAPTIDDVERAEALLAGGQSKAAITLLERTAFSNPEHSQVWQLLTTALLQAEEYERAAITSYAFEALAPSPLAYLLRSQALLHVDPHEALTPALSAQAACPESWEAHAQVARSYLVGRDATQAGLRAAHTAVELAPGVAEAHAVLALSYRRHEQFAEAEAAAGRALSIDHTNQEARDLLDGLALMRPMSAGTERRSEGGQRLGRWTLPVVVIVVCLLILAPFALLVVGSQAAYVSALVVAGSVLLLALLVRTRSAR